MYECGYVREPFDLKLMILRLVRRLWIPVLVSVFTGLAAGGIYLLKNVLFAGPDEYVATTAYYVEYGISPVTGNEFTYINGYTWNEWVRMDEFTDRVLSNMPEGSLDKETLKSCLTAELPSDLHMPVSKVTTQDPKLANEVNLALQTAFFEFGQEMREIDNIKIVNIEEASPVRKESRLPQNIIVGTLAGALAALAVMLVRYLLDESIWIPATFTFRYGVPAIGAVTFPGGKLTPIAEENFRHLFAGKDIAVTALESDVDLKAVAGLLPEDKKVVTVPSVEFRPEGVDKLREAEAVLLVVRSGADNGKRIERLLDFLKLQDCSVAGALLWQADVKLLKAYYFGCGKKDW